MDWTFLVAYSGDAGRRLVWLAGRDLLAVLKKFRDSDRASVKLWTLKSQSTSADSARREAADIAAHWNMKPDESVSPLDSLVTAGEIEARDIIQRVF